ncbi:hypothetical protein IWQ60_001301 [Tieghemiomyces parasiticus]|uniref:Uncharacterized protein n=1 Tax=Tieghemiomyces parasiticus TaxID=78921 RepID=A0A9W8DWQ5_9FUNG|nr:hypothetical protein IWQ60_001301 [Tieghemiomyces parasiticus]
MSRSAFRTGIFGLCALALLQPQVYADRNRDTRNQSPLVPGAFVELQSGYYRVHPYKDQNGQAKVTTSLIQAQGSNTEYFQVGMVTAAWGADGSYQTQPIVDQGPYPAANIGTNGVYASGPTGSIPLSPKDVFQLRWNDQCLILNSNRGGGDRHAQPTPGSTGTYGYVDELTLGDCTNTASYLLAEVNSPHLYQSPTRFCSALDRDLNLQTTDQGLTVGPIHYSSAPANPNPSGQDGFSKPCVYFHVRNKPGYHCDNEAILNFNSNRLTLNDFMERLGLSVYDLRTTLSTDVPLTAQTSELAFYANCHGLEATFRQIKDNLGIIRNNYHTTSTDNVAYAEQRTIAMFDTFYVNPLAALLAKGDSDMTSLERYIRYGTRVVGKIAELVNAVLGKMISKAVCTLGDVACKYLNSRPPSNLPENVPDERTKYIQQVRDLAEGINEGIWREYADNLVDLTLQGILEEAKATPKKMTLASDQRRSPTSARTAMAASTIATTSLREASNHHRQFIIKLDAFLFGVIQALVRQNKMDKVYCVAQPLIVYGRQKNADPSRRQLVMPEPAREFLREMHLEPAWEDEKGLDVVKDWGLPLKINRVAAYRMFTPHC